MDFDASQAKELLDSLQVGVVVHSEDTSVIYANLRALELLRLTSSQALGKDAYDPHWRFLDKYGKPMPVEDYPVNKVIASQAPIVDLQAGIIDSSGEVTWVNCNAYPNFDDAGNVRRIIVNFIDITTQKEAIPFQEIVALSKDAILVTEAKRIDEPGPTIIYTNQAFCELTGYTVDEVMGQSPRFLQGPQTDPEALKRIRAAIKDKVPVRQTLLNYRKDGSPYWNELSIYPLKNEYGEVVNFVGVQRDASVRKKREEQLNRSNLLLLEKNEELQALDKLKNQTMGIVAHDLRNPLYAVATSLDLLEECIRREDPEVVSIMQASLESMNAIIEDLLENQLLHGSNLSLDKEPHDVAVLLHEVQSFHTRHAAKKAISIRTHLPKEMTVTVDQSKLHRALDNLLSNAIKFSPKNSEVCIGCEETETGMIRLFVQDSGPGLTEEDKLKAFAPFQRLSAQPTDGEHSTGLGLSIVKKVAQLHGGDAGVISQHLRGATFFLDIPK